MFGVTVFWACSDERSITSQSDTKANLRTFSSEEFGELRAIVDVFYEEEVTFDIGRTATVSEEDAHYDCTEIIFAGHERARGYLVSDHETGEFLYLADVDRTNYVLKTLDIANAERETIRDINLLPDYGASDGFDIIGVIGTEPIVQPNGWFWGKWNCEQDPNNFIIIPPTYDSEGMMTHPGDIQCSSTCEIRRFGFTVGTEETWSTCSWAY
ncbi:MAG: hypothetical protein WCY06_05895 [Flavobacteriaceae bacterium]